MTLRGGVTLLAAQSRADLRQRRECSGLTDRDHFWRLGEIVPHKGLYVRFDDHVRLRAPFEISVALENIESAAENVRERARCLNGPPLHIHRDNNVDANTHSASHG